ncbi:MAG TPA: tetratricopeptide repeat protein, partial [Pyrinomonadaceae bacterium]|nr:tetratricopeptide repeat protein [Pyrinomonadaceae bacterium]
AYQAYLMGVHFWTMRTRENLTKAIQYLEQAVEKDPNYAQAHAILADAYFLSGTDQYQTRSVAEALARAESSANRALALDDQIAEAHTVKACILQGRQQPEEAMIEFRRAIDLKPTYSVAHLRYAYFLMWSLRIDQALSHMKRAQQLDPASPITNAALGSVLLVAREYDEAIKYSQRALELEPTQMAARINLADAYLEKKMFTEALQELEKIPERNDEYVIAEKGYAYALAGRKQEAMKLFAQLEKIVGEKGAPYMYARFYGALGDNDKAFEWLEKANLNKMVQANLKYDAQIDPLRNDPRFNEFLKRHNVAYLLNEGELHKVSTNSQ